MLKTDLPVRLSVLCAGRSCFRQERCFSSLNLCHGIASPRSEKPLSLFMTSSSLGFWKSLLSMFSALSAFFISLSVAEGWRQSDPVTELSRTGSSFKEGRQAQVLRPLTLSALQEVFVPDILRSETCVFFLQHVQAVDAVEQLSDVAGPVIFHQCFNVLYF